MRPQYRYRSFNLITDPDKDNQDKRLILSTGEGLVFIKHEKLYFVSRDLYTNKV